MNIIDVMKENSLAWHTASASEKKRLERENQVLGKKLDASYDANTGTWSKGNKRLYTLEDAPEKKENKDIEIFYNRQPMDKREAEEIEKFYNRQPNDQALEESKQYVNEKVSETLDNLNIGDDLKKFGMVAAVVLFIVALIK